jgi:hypothetical protein
MSAQTMLFHFDAQTKEARFYSQDGMHIFTMGELSFREANDINEAIRSLEKRAYDRGAAEAINRARQALRGMEETISLDNEEDDPRPKVRNVSKKKNKRKN